MNRAGGIEMPRMGFCDGNNFGFWQILLQKSLMVSTINDSLALTRFVAEAGDDGAAQS